MSASGFTPIQLFRTTTAAQVPSAASLAAGELAINLTDERLFFKNAAGTVKLLASNAGSTGSVTSVGVSGGTTGLTTSGGPITSSGTITLAGTLAVANGGTGAVTAVAALTALGAYPAANPSGYTANVGTATSVAGTGTVNGSDERCGNWHSQRDQPDRHSYHRWQSDPRWHSVWCKPNLSGNWYPPPCQRRHWRERCGYCSDQPQCPLAHRG